MIITMNKYNNEYIKMYGNLISWKVFLIILANTMYKTCRTETHMCLSFFKTWSAGIESLFWIFFC